MSSLQENPIEGDATTCEEVNGFLAEYIEGTLSDDTSRQFRAHLDKCPACVNHFDQYRLTIDLVRAEGKVPVPECLVEHTLSFLRERIDRAAPGR
jgi:anti-sigma factor RsiW